MITQFAGCVLTDDYGRILLLHRATADTTQWELPGGAVREDEAPEVAVVQQINDQLGIDVRLVRPLGVGAYEIGEVEYQYIWFQAVVTGADPALRGTSTYDDLDYFELEDMLSLALAPDLQLLLDKIFSGEVALDA